MAATYSNVNGTYTVTWDGPVSYASSGPQPDPPKPKFVRIPGPWRKSDRRARIESRWAMRQKTNG